MEDLLTLDEEPDAPRRPVVCCDERPCQLSGEVLVPLPLKPGRSKRQNYAYERPGPCGVLRAFVPWSSWRFVQVSERRPAVDSALFRQELVEQYSPVIERIRLVPDNLNTQTPGSFYSAFPPPEAFAFAQKFEIH